MELKKVWEAIKCLLSQLLLTLYDDFEYKYISLPRVWCAISGICVITAWVAEQFFNCKFGGYTQLVAWASTCLGAYAVKKYSEGGK